MKNDITNLDFLPLSPVYRIKNTGESDINLAKLLSKSKTLTLNAKSLTGFDEIELLSLQEKTDKKYEYLLNACEKTYQDFDILINDIQNCLTNTLYQILLTPEPKIFFTSGGSDSRIIAHIVKDIENKYGKSLTDNIVFVCHHPESEFFKNSMKQMGWPADKYHVHKENEKESGDYYDLCNFNLNSNCFDYTMHNIWSDIASIGKENNYSVVLGLFGGELLSNPLWRPLNKLKMLNNRFRYVSYYEFDHVWELAPMNLLFKNIYLPYLNYDYLNIVFRIHESLYQYYDVNGTWFRRIDKIRKALLDNFNDNTESVTGRKFRFGLSKEKINYIQNCWIKSKFYNDFKDEKIVKDATPWLSPRRSLDNKLYSLATTYENK